jgi:hypothetical protein
MRAGRGQLGLAQPWQRGRLQRPAAVLRQPLLRCFSVVAYRAGARVRGAALPHRLYAARTLACHSRVLSLSLANTMRLTLAGLSLKLSPLALHTTWKEACHTQVLKALAYTLAEG